MNKACLYHTGTPFRDNDFRRYVALRYSESYLYAYKQQASLESN